MASVCKSPAQTRCTTAALHRLDVICIHALLCAFKNLQLQPIVRNLSSQSVHTCKRCIACKILTCDIHAVMDVPPAQLEATVQGEHKILHILEGLFGVEGGCRRAARMRNRRCCRWWTVAPAARRQESQCRPPPSVNTWPLWTWATSPSPSSKCLSFPAPCARMRSRAEYATQCCGASVLGVRIGKPCRQLSSSTWLHQCIVRACKFAANIIVILMSIPPANTAYTS